MAELVGGTPLKIVQGATKTTRIKFDKAISSLITNVYFSCKRLNLEYELTRNEYDEFEFTIDEETSKGLEAVKTTYDISVRINGNIVAIQTGVPFIVRKRQNPLGIGEEYGYY